MAPTRPAASDEDDERDTISPCASSNAVLSSSDNATLPGRGGTCIEADHPRKIPRARERVQRLDPRHERSLFDHVVRERVEVVRRQRDGASTGGKEFAEPIAAVVEPLAKRTNPKAERSCRKADRARIPLSPKPTCRELSRGCRWRRTSA